MSTTPTAAPSRAKRIAPARPIPEAAAVTMPILPSSRMSFTPSSRDFLALIERVERRAIGFAEHMALDLQGRRHLAVCNGKGFACDYKTPHPLIRREHLVDSRHDSSDRFRKGRIAGKSGQISRRVAGDEICVRHDD